MLESQCRSIDPQEFARQDPYDVEGGDDACAGKGKSADSFGPIGPWLVTKDEVADPQDLKMWLKVNGKMMQNGSTKTMVYGVKYLVAYLSQFMSLQPGDIISTGTPPGVGLGMKPPKFLKAKDKVELGIEGLGTQMQVCVQDG